jgi:putative NADPH-quinone reductase
MSKYVSNILLILASPIDPKDKRLNEIGNLTQTFVQTVSSKGIVVDSIDLFAQTDFQASSYYDINDSKILEFQIRLNKADMVVFFHPVWLDGVPSRLKGWLENVLSSGYAYKTENKLPIGLLDTKKSIVFSFDDKPSWQSKAVYGNQLENFWYKSIFSLSGIDGKLYNFDQFRSANDKDIAKWKSKITKIADNIKTKPSLLDL